MIRVTDHALLRFLERAGGFDVEGTRSAIEASLGRAAEAADKIGARELLVVSDGLCFVVREGRAVTVVAQGSPGALASILNGPRVPNPT